MGIGAAIVIGLFGLVGTIVGASMNKKNNEFIEDMNEDNQKFQQEVNEQNHEWSLEAAEWEYEHNKPQRQYADLLEAGLTPAAAAQKLSGANVSYSPATAIAPRNAPKSMDTLSDSLSQVFDELGNFANVEQTLASAEKTRAETKVINETAINKANAEIEKILTDILKTYSDIDVNSSQIDLNQANTESTQASTDLTQANTDLVNERVKTEEVNRRSIELSNQEKEIQLDFTRKTLEMSVQKTEAEIKLLSEQTAKLQGEVESFDFDVKYKEWRNTYIETYGVAPEQGWEDTLFKAVVDGKAQPMLEALSESLRLIFSTGSEEIKSRSDDFNNNVVRKHFGSLKDLHDSKYFW